MRRSCQNIQKKAKQKITQVMREFKKGKLRSGGKKKVTDCAQAIAIGISEAKEAGYKVSDKK
jgi:hypothetical protein